MDGKLLGRHPSYSGNPQEWSAYVGVIAPPIFTPVDPAEPMTAPIMVDGLSEEDHRVTRSLSFLLAPILSGPLQLMMNVGEQNGLEAWRLLVRSEHAVTGANRSAATQSILQYEFSPGFDMLKAELRTFEGLVRTCRATFGEEIPDSITQTVIMSQMPAEIRPHPELQTFARTAELTRLMSSLSKTRMASAGASPAAHGLVPVEISWVENKGHGKEKGKGKKKGKSKGKSTGKKGEKFEGWCNNCGKRGDKSCQLLAQLGETGAPGTKA